MGSIARANATPPHAANLNATYCPVQPTKMTQFAPSQARHPSSARRLAAKRDTPKETAATSAKKKLGFPVPIRVWLKEDGCYQTVKACFTGESAKQFFHTDRLVKLLDDHRAGKADNSRKIWTVYMFLVWYQVYFAEDSAFLRG